MMKSMTAVDDNPLLRAFDANGRVRDEIKAAVSLMAAAEVPPETVLRILTGHILAALRSAPGLTGATSDLAGMVPVGTA